MPESDYSKVSVSGQKGEIGASLPKGIIVLWDKSSEIPLGFVQINGAFEAIFSDISNLIFIQSV